MNITNLFQTIYYQQQSQFTSLVDLVFAGFTASIYAERLAYFET